MSESDPPPDDPDLPPLPDPFNPDFIFDLAEIQSCLVRRCMVKTRHAWNRWERDQWPPHDDDPIILPIRLMDIALKGDELWWYESPQETWDMLCGRAGWALVRDGKVVDEETMMIN